METDLDGYKYSVIHTKNRNTNNNKNRQCRSHDKSQRTGRTVSQNNMYSLVKEDEEDKWSKIVKPLQTDLNATVS